MGTRGRWDPSTFLPRAATGNVLSRRTLLSLCFLAPHCSNTEEFRRMYGRQLQMGE